MCIGKATHRPMRARKLPPASSLTLPDTLLIFLYFESGDSVISAALGDAEGYHPANHEDLYRFSTSTRFDYSLFSSSRLDPFPSIMCSRTDARHRSNWRVSSIRM
ncbi:hypothetical protein DPSP01_006233 [Paraphaeosphaeria sporulosa]